MTDDAMQMPQSCSTDKGLRALMHGGISCAERPSQIGSKADEILMTNHDRKDDENAFWKSDRDSCTI